LNAFFFFNFNFAYAKYSDEKCEQIESLKDEIDNVKRQVNKLRNENAELQQRATIAGVYSDELESLREKSVKVDRYESEIGKLRERIDELQESRSRFEVRTLTFLLSFLRFY
jgi:prefoldin subunit 5